MDIANTIDTSVLHNIIAHNADGIMITDVDNIIIYTNDAFAEMLGYAHHEMVGNTPAMFKSGAHDVEFYKQMWNDLLAVGCWKGELLDRRKDGQTIPTQTTITAVLNPNTNTIQNYVAITRDTTHIKQYEEELRSLAFYDHLTGLYNRRLFDQFVAEHHSLAKRNGTKYAIILIDLDDFGLINSLHGHLGGDAVLKHVATSIKNVFRRDQDIVARLGGDEFVVLVTNMDEDVSPSDFCTHTCKEFVNAMSRPVIYNNQTIAVTASVGVAFSNSNLTDATDLLVQADSAMYESKNRGKNSYTVFGEMLG